MWFPHIQMLRNNNLTLIANFFTSYNLLVQLAENDAKATGTIWENHSAGASEALMTSKVLKKMERGSFDFRCDGKVCAAKWNDNAIVGIASTVTGKPMTLSTPWKEEWKVEQKKFHNLVWSNLMDRLSASYRPMIRGEKWYWPLFLNTVTLPPWERYLNWVHDIAPPPSRDHGKKDLSPPSRDHGKENLPPPEEPRKLQRKIRPRRRQEKHHSHSSSQTGSQPGTSRSPRSAMRAPVKHPLTSQRPQPPSPAANHNSSRDYLRDHYESGQVYKPASSSIQQDSTTRSHRDDDSGSGLSPPALQRSHRDSFSGSPLGQPNRKVQLTDPLREARIAGGWRPGPVQSHPCAAHPDVRLEIDAALPEAAAVSRAERPPVVLEIPESEWLEPAHRSEPPRRRGPRSPRRRRRKRPRNRSSALYQPRKRPAPTGHWCD